MAPFGGSFRDLDLTLAGDRSYPSTEDSAERGFARLDWGQHDPVTYEHLGRGETLDEEEAGDIADEGRGHRG